MVYDQRNEPTNMKKEKSEFGKGMLICMIKFAEHQSQHNGAYFPIYRKFIEQTPEKRKLMLQEDPPSNLNYGFPFMTALKNFVRIAEKVHKGDYEKAFSYEIELFMNSASDHLYEIEVPEGKSWDKIRAMVKKLQSKGLHIGHGFDAISKWTMDDYYELFQLNREIALKIDKKLGLKADIGNW
jgi:hypothetical protein